MVDVIVHPLVSTVDAHFFEVNRVLGEELDQLDANAVGLIHPKLDCKSSQRVCQAGEGSAIQSYDVQVFVHGVHRRRRRLAFAAASEAIERLGEVGLLFRSQEIAAVPAVHGGVALARRRGEAEREVARGGAAAEEVADGHRRGRLARRRVVPRQLEVLDAGERDEELGARRRPAGDGDVLEVAHLELEGPDAAEVAEEAPEEVAARGGGGVHVVEEVEVGTRHVRRRGEGEAPRVARVPERSEPRRVDLDGAGPQWAAASPVAVGLRVRPAPRQHERGGGRREAEAVAAVLHPVEGDGVEVHGGERRRGVDDALQVVRVHGAGLQPQRRQPRGFHGGGGGGRHAQAAAPGEVQHAEGLRRDVAEVQVEHPDETPDLAAVVVIVDGRRAGAEAELLHAARRRVGDHVADHVSPLHPSVRLSLDVIAEPQPHVRVGRRRRARIKRPLRVHEPVDHIHGRRSKVQGEPRDVAASTSGCGGGERRLRGAEEGVMAGGDGGVDDAVAVAAVELGEAHGEVDGAGGAPERAPPRREQAGGRGLVGRREAEDALDEVVGERRDAVDAAGHRRRRIRAGEGEGEGDGNLSVAWRNVRGYASQWQAVRVRVGVMAKQTGL